MVLGNYEAYGGVSELLSILTANFGIALSSTAVGTTLVKAGT